MNSLPFGSIAGRGFDTKLGVFDLVNDGFMGHIFNWGARGLNMKIFLVMVMQITIKGSRMLTNQYIRIVFVWFLTINLTSCKVHYDKNLLNKMEVFKSQCYQTVHPSFLYNLNVCSTRESCFGIQAYDAYSDFKYDDIPDSKSQLEADIGYWNKVIDSNPNLSGWGRNYYSGSLKASTKFKIVNIHLANVPGYGAYWKAIGEIVEGKHTGRFVEFPSGLFYISPNWLIQDGFSAEPSWDDDFVVNCGDRLDKESR